jgi:transposase InsO family protein
LGTDVWAVSLSSLQAATAGQWMRENGIKIVRTQKYKATTDSNHTFNIAPNLLGQDFSADGPNQKWAGDISYIWTSEGWLYLAVILDLYSRRVIGWAPSRRYCVSTAGQRSATACSGIWRSGRWTWLWRYGTRPKAAFTVWIAARNTVPTSISVACQSMASRFPLSCMETCTAGQWMSGKGNCYDNSMVETFFKSIKAELIWRNRRDTRRQAQGAIFQYVNGFYNPRRRHSSLGGKSPLAFERKAA